MKLTQEQLAELIAKVFTNLDEKRKACKENGEAVSDGISTEEILAEVTAILEGEGEGGVTDPTATNDPTNPAPTADPVAGDKGEGEGVSPELIAAIIAALEGQGVKSARWRRREEVRRSRCSEAARAQVRQPVSLYRLRSRRCEAELFPDPYRVHVRT